MNEKLFIVGIGGTGMRCLESFIHICAMGLFGGTEINVLALDTDLENGNFARLKELVEECYLRIKGFNKPHFAVKDSLFSAKVNFFKFSPDYSKDSTGNLRKLSKLIDVSDQEKQLYDLLFTGNVQSFDLKHGYRAQTHLGSLLMYHSIIEEVRKNPQGELGKFIEEMYNASESGPTKAFVLGSVFGGTGASSIPIIPKAFNDALEVKMPGKSLNKIFFGSTLLTSYFTFPAPDNQSKSAQKIIADAKNFAMNSQAAMMFYEDDNTVKTTYQKFYMVGTPSNAFQSKQEGNETVTGGAKQCNDSHYIELVAAFAAYDFLMSPVDQLSKIKNDDKTAQYYFRTCDDNGAITFQDLVNDSQIEDLVKRFTCLTATSFLVSIFDFFEQARSGALKSDNVFGYEDIANEEVDALKKYFELFHFKIKDGNVIDGWLRQLHYSAGGGSNFMFNPDMFACRTVTELKKFDTGKIFRSKQYEDHNAKGGLFKSHFDQFKGKFKETKDGDLSNRCEKLIQRMYFAVRDLHQFKQ